MLSVSPLIVSGLVPSGSAVAVPPLSRYSVAVPVQATASSVPLTAVTLVIVGTVADPLPLSVPYRCPANAPCGRCCVVAATAGGPVSSVLPSSVP